MEMLTVRNTTMRTENRSLYICITLHLAVRPFWRGHLLRHSFGVCAKRNTANTTAAPDTPKGFRLHYGDWLSGTSLQSKRDNPMLLKYYFPTPSSCCFLVWVYYCRIPTSSTRPWLKKKFSPTFPRRGQRDDRHFWGNACLGCGVFILGR